MTLSSFAMMFGPSIVFVLLGVFFWIFPINFPEQRHYAKDDISRYMGHNGISPAFLENFSPNQLDYFKKVGPKIYVIAGLLDACVLGILLLFSFHWNISYLCTINAIILIFSTFMFIGIKSSNHKKS